jgi:GNAT superfamily N-acetyltransferase
MSRQPIGSVPAADILSVTVTYLEMTAPPTGAMPPRPSEHVRVHETREPTVAFYRWLYHQVGDPYLWYERKRVRDADLARILADSATRIWVLTVGHVPAGFFELDTRMLPKATNIAYFGLMPEFVGQGLGRFFLECAIRAAWATDAPKVTVNTCTLDHPRALPLYRAAGFTIVERQLRRIVDPRMDWRVRRRPRPRAPLSGSGSG